MTELRSTTKTRRNASMAVHRSRAARAAWQRRRRRTIALTAASLAALTVPVAWTLDAMSGGALVEAAVTRAQSLTDLLSQRSPGARTQAVLTKNKPAHAAAKLRAAPKKPARPGPFETPASDSPVEFAALVETAIPVTFAPPALQPAYAPPPSLGGILSSVPGVAALTPPQGGGHVSFPTAQPREPVVQPSAVPEPGTWATMLLGFALIGWRVRRRAAARATIRTA